MKIAPSPITRLTIEHRNDGAEWPLLLPLAVICNTTDEQLLENIRVNSLAHKGWLKLAEPHDRVAVLCGSGPSLADTLDEIRERAARGETVFGLNAAAGFLAENGIRPAYQVIADARDATADLIGPADHHLFASQVSPLCFGRKTRATLWHMIIDGIDDVLPDYDDDYCLIGGGSSIGCTALYLAFAMGYRKFAAYGYDSSYRGDKHHAMPQALNDEEAVIDMSFKGVAYQISLTMRGQCKTFFGAARHLQSQGCTIEVHGDGILPAMWRAGFEGMEEQQKYEAMWSLPEYRRWSPGEDAVDAFFDRVKPEGLVIDFGCGTGRAAMKIEGRGCDVIAIDFASNCLDHPARGLRFYTLDMSKPMPFRASYGLCADVMEHVPPDQVEAVIDNIMASAKTVFFQISTVPDAMGVHIGQILHLSVLDHEGWRMLFEHKGYAVSFSVDRGDNSQFVVSRKDH